jgi:hypothetical protein
MGDGGRASFWHDSWCEHGSLHLWAPDLYKIATGKKRTVEKETKDGNWISIDGLTMPVQLSQYLEIWEIVASLQLVPAQPDSISWTLTSDGKYSASSTYHVQIMGSHPRFFFFPCTENLEC